MASIDIFYKISILIIFLLVLDPQFTNASSSSISNLLSLLTKKLNINKQPLIVILDEHRGAVKSDFSPTAEVTSDEDDVVHLTKHLLAHDKAKGKPIQLKKTTKSLSREKLHKQRYRAQRIREEEGLRTEDRSVLRSPIIKKLLRISNSLRCEAKDECRDKCTNKFNGKKVKKCVVQCEVKYVCEEEDEEKDPCIEDECRDSCGGSDECKGLSTKGERLVTKSPSCVRC